MRETYEQLMELFDELKREIRLADRLLYERWKAGGFIVDPDILSVYPDIGKVIELLEPEGEEEEEDVEVEA